MAHRWICAASALTLCLLLSTSDAAAPRPWSSLEAGLEHRKVSFTPASGDGVGVVHFFRIDPRRWKLRLITAHRFNRDSATIKFLAQEGRARLAVNGGFFGTDFKPLGLRISDGVLQNPVRRISWWGIFAIVLGKPQLFSVRDYAPAAPPEFAVQSGPRLVVGGSIPSTLKEGLDQRSGIGVTAEGLIVLAVTENAWLTTTEFAQWMRSSEGGGCTNALNLDGGHSSQLYYSGRYGEISIENASTIVDAIGVYKGP